MGVKLAILVTLLVFESILVAVIVFDVAGLNSHRDGGHPGHNPLNCHRLSGRTAKRLGATDRLTTCKANPEEGNIIKQQAQTRLDCHQVTKQHHCGPQTPSPHGTTGREEETRKNMRSSCCHRLTTCMTNPQEGEFHNQQAHLTEPQSTTGANTPQDHSGGDGETRCPFMLAATDRVTSCKPNPQERQIINQEAKTSLIVTETKC